MCMGLDFIELFGQIQQRGNGSLHKICLTCSYHKKLLYANKCYAQQTIKGRHILQQTIKGRHILQLHGMLNRLSHFEFLKKYNDSNKIIFSVLCKNRYRKLTMQICCSLVNMFKSIKPLQLQAQGHDLQGRRSEPGTQYQRWATLLAD